MKKIVLLAFLLLTQVGIFSQMRGGCMNRQGYKQKRQAQPSESSKFNINNMTQFYFYDSSVVLKILKIKKEALRIEIISEIEIYNNKLIELRAFNKDTFIAAKSYLKSKKEDFKLTGNSSIMPSARKKLKEMLAPIRKKVILQKKKLNEALLKKLTPKQYSKWLKYQERKSKSSSKKNKNQSNMKSQKNGQNQGYNRRNF